MLYHFEVKALGGDQYGQGYFLSYEKKRSIRVFVFFLTLALFRAGRVPHFWVHWPLAFAVAWAAMMANILKSYPDVLDSRRKCGCGG